MINPGHPCPKLRSSASGVVGEPRSSMTASTVISVRNPGHGCPPIHKQKHARPQPLARTCARGKRRGTPVDNSFSCKRFNHNRFSRLTGLEVRCKPDNNECGGLPLMECLESPIYGHMHACRCAPMSIHEIITMVPSWTYDARPAWEMVAVIYTLCLL